MKVHLKNVRLAFPALFEARAQTGTDGKPGKPKFSATFIFPREHAALQEMSAAIEAVGAAKWGAKWPGIRTSLQAGGKLCLRNGDTKAEYQGFPGNLFVSSSSDRRPTVVARDRSPLTAQDGKPYAGCYVNAFVSVWAQDNTYGKRINAEVTGVQFMADGDSFGGGAAPADANDFEELGDGADAAFEGSTSAAASLV